MGTIPMTAVNTEPYRDGYPAVAAWISRDPDHETYVFRRFDRLSARTLLYLQSELTDLEAKLEAFDRETTASNDMELKQSARKWETFAANVERRRPQEIERMRLVQNIEVKLKKYHEALLLQSRIAHMKTPNDRVLQAYRNWFLGHDKNDPVLGGRARNMLDDKQDLAALRTLPDKDVLSRILQDHWPFPVHGTPTDPEDHTRHFHERHVVTTVTILSGIIAAGLLISSIVSLYIVTNPDARLGMVIAFISAFYIGMSICTSASLKDVVSATAAYAAVVIVFVSGNLGSANSGTG